MNHCEEDDDSDLDTDEIKGQLRNMQAALQRHFGHHKVNKTSRFKLVVVKIELFQSLHQTCED